MQSSVKAIILWMLAKCKFLFLPNLRPNRICFWFWTPRVDPKLYPILFYFLLLATRSKSCEPKNSTSCKSRNSMCMKNEFPIQRDITCGFHNIVKTCCCKAPVPAEALILTSEDDLVRMSSTSVVKKEKSKSIKFQPENFFRCQFTSPNSLL